MTRLTRETYGRPPSANGLERFDWGASITLDRDRFKGLMSLEWVECKENVIMTGPVGVGKSFLANALAHSACRRNKSVFLVKAAKMFKVLYAARDRKSTRLNSSH